VYVVCITLGSDKIAHKIQSIISKPGIPMTYLNEMLTSQVSDGTDDYNVVQDGMIDFSQRLDSGEPIGYKNSNYTGPRTAAELDPTCSLSVMQELSERNTPTSNVGYTHIRRALDYRMMICYEVAEWFGEMQALYELAKMPSEDGQSLRDDIWVKYNLGYEEAFLLACGDLTVAPWHMRASDDPDVDVVWAVLKEAILDIGFLDHTSFDVGWNSRSTGVTTFPGTGQSLVLLERDTVTSFLTHPWRALTRNPSLRPKFQSAFSDRSPSNAWLARTYGVNDHTGVFNLIEGGASTQFQTIVESARRIDPSVSLAEGEIPDHSILNKLTTGLDTLLDFEIGDPGTGAPSSSQMLGRSSQIMHSAAYVSQFMNDGDWILSVLKDNFSSATMDQGAGNLQYTATVSDGDDWSGSRTIFDFQEWHDYSSASPSRSVENNFDIIGRYKIEDMTNRAGSGQDSEGCNAYSGIPSCLSLSSPSKVYGHQMVEILRLMKRGFSDEVEHILSELGRIKKSLPSSAKQTGLGTYGKAYHNSLRDGYITSHGPAWNFKAKLTRASHNGPTFIASQLTGSTSGVGTPHTMDGEGQWGGNDTTCKVSIPDLLTGGTLANTDGLPQRFSGLYGDGLINRYTPAHFSADSLLASKSEEYKVRSDMLTYPLVIRSNGELREAQVADPTYLQQATGDASDVYLPQYFATSANLFWVVPDSGGSADNEGVRHYHPVRGFMRGMAIYGPGSLGGASTNGDSCQWFYKPRELSLVGDEWYSWAGSHMGASVWLDPYRPMPFSVSTALLGAPALTTLDHSAITIVAQSEALSSNAEFNSEYQADSPGQEQLSFDDNVQDWLGNVTCNYGGAGGNEWQWLTVYGSGRNLDFAGGTNTDETQSFYDVLAPGSGSPAASTTASKGVVSAFRDIQNACDTHSSSMKHSNIKWGLGISGHVSATGGTSLRDATLNAKNVTITNNELDVALPRQPGSPAPSSVEHVPIVVVSGDYTINPQFGDITPANVLPLAWMGQVYTNEVFHDFNQRDFMKNMMGFTATRIGTAYRDEGTHTLNNICYATKTADKVGLDPTTGTEAKRTIDAWFEDGAASPSTVDRRNKVLGGQSPWIKGIGTEAGYSRTSYEAGDIQSQDDGLRRAAMASYGKLTTGLTNDLFRKIQIVN